MTPENAAPRPNFFILLGLDPQAPWNDAAFESLLQDKRKEWSRQSALVGQKAIIAKQYLGLIPEITRVMTDPALRKGEAAAAKVIMDATLKQRLEAFEQQIAYINAKESANEADLEHILNGLIEDFKDVLSPQEIKRRVTVRVKNGPNDDKTISQLDPTIAKKINDLLQIFNKQTLYELLNLPTVTATADLYRIAEGLYREATRRVPKSAEVTALTELSGLAMEIFKTEEMRKRYDESLRLATLDNLLHSVNEMVSRSAKKRLDLDQVTLFLEDAKKAGWEQEEALHRLEDYSVQHKWALLVPGSIEPKVLCGNCQHLNRLSDKKCTNCGVDLSLACPRCGNAVSNTQRMCGNCGFEVGNHILVDHKLKEAREITELRDIDKLKDLVKTAEQSWRLGPDKQDQRSREIEELHKTIARLEEQLLNITRKLDALMDQKKFFAAREVLDKVGEHIPQQQRAEKQRVIDEKIDRAESLLKQVKHGTQSLSLAQQVIQIRQVLQICADYEDAQVILKTLPLEPPRNLRAQVLPSSVRLTWDASPTPEVDYTVVCSEHKPPNSAKDGKELKNTTGLTFEDTAPKIGVPLFYAVFVGFETVPSDYNVVLAQPVMLMQEVQSVSAQVGNQWIELSWEYPPNAQVHSCIVVRKSGSQPRNSSDGTRVGGQFGPQEKSVKDTGLHNGQVYFYGLYCQYLSFSGTLLQTSGTFISAIPEDPPQPPAVLDILHVKKGSDYHITVNWQYTGKGEVVIIKSDKPLSTLANKGVTMAELSNAGSRLTPNPGESTVTDIWDKQGMAYFTPVVLLQQIAYVGISQAYSCINIYDVKAQNCETYVRLTWKWPDGCQKVKLSIRTDQLPNGHHDPHAKSLDITREEFKRNGGRYELRGAREQDYYLLLSAILSDADERPILAKGVEIVTRQRTKLPISYEIRNSAIMGISTFSGRKRQLYITYGNASFSINAYNIPIPKLLLVAKQGGVPFNAQDGDQLKEIQWDGKKTQTVVLNGNYPPNTFVRLFLEDEDWSDRVELSATAEEKVRLS